MGMGMGKEAEMSGLGRGVGLGVGWLVGWLLEME